MWIYPVIALKVIVHIFLIFFKAENGNKRSVFGAFWLEISPANCGDAAAAGEEADQLNCFEHSPQNPSHGAISTFSPDFTEFPLNYLIFHSFWFPLCFLGREVKTRKGVVHMKEQQVSWTGRELLRVRVEKPELPSPCFSTTLHPPIYPPHCVDSWAG